MKHIIVRDADREALDAKLAKLNRRALRLGSPSFGYEVVRTLELPVHLAGRLVGSEPAAELRPVGEPPVVNGWRFAARLEHTVGGAIIDGPDTEAAEAFRHAPQACGHCNMRRNRKDTFVLLNEESGVAKQIGRSCLQDFIRSTPAAALAYWAMVAAWQEEANKEPDEDRERSYGSGSWGLKLSLVLQAAADSIEEYGYAKSEDDHSTKGDVWDRLWSRKRSWRPSEKAQQTARSTESWMKLLADEHGYRGNLYALVRHGLVESRRLGLACSAVHAYLTEVGRAKEREAKAAGKTSGHVGEVGERLKGIEVEVEFRTSWDTQWGSSGIIVMRDSDGNRYAWKTASWPELNEKYLLTGTVKAHSEYREEKQTEVTRCKLSKVA